MRGIYDLFCSLYWLHSSIVLCVPQWMSQIAGVLCNIGNTFDEITVYSTQQCICNLHRSKQLCESYTACCLYVMSCVSPILYGLGWIVHCVSWVCLSCVQRSPWFWMLLFIVQQQLSPFHAMSIDISKLKQNFFTVHKKSEFKNLL